MSCRTWKNHQILQKLFENEENLVIFTVILMAAAFGMKDVHSDIGWAPILRSVTGGGISIPLWISIDFVAMFFPQARKSRINLTELMC